MVDRNAFERRDGQLADDRTIGFLERAYVDGHERASYARTAPGRKRFVGLKRPCAMPHGSPSESTRSDDVYRELDPCECQASELPVSSELVQPPYPCPHCRVELDAPAGSWDGWVRCPSCERTFLPPEAEKLPLGRNAAMVSNSRRHSARTTVQPRRHPRLSRSPGLAPAGWLHTSPARVVFTTGFVLCLFLTLIYFLDCKTRASRDIRVLDDRLLSAVASDPPEAIADGRDRRESDRRIVAVRLCCSSNNWMLSREAKTPIRLPSRNSVCPTHTPTSSPLARKRPPPERPCSGTLSDIRNDRGSWLSLSSNVNVSITRLLHPASLIPRSIPIEVARE